MIPIELKYAIIYLLVGFVVTLYDLMREGGATAVKKKALDKEREKHGVSVSRLLEDKISTFFWIGCVISVLLCPIVLGTVIKKEIRQEYNKK